METSKKIKNAIEELNSLNDEFKKTKEVYELKKKKLSYLIQDYMGANNIDSLDFISKAKKTCKVIFVKPKKIIFDANKLEKKLDKDIYKQVVSKEYRIDDIDGFLSYLKSIKGNPKIIKGFLNIQKNVNNDKINELSELGYITESDIKDCYSVKEISSYLKISEVDNEESGGE